PTPASRGVPRLRRGAPSVWGFGGHVGAPMTRQCPSCGAPVTFTSAQSLLAVCGYCRASLIRRDLDVEQFGTMSAPLEGSPPLQLAAEGVWRSTHFAVVGRVQIRWEHGMWNEWHCLFDD